MRNLLSTLIVTTVMTISSGAILVASESMPYQAVVRDGSGNLVSNSTVTSKVSIIKGSASGTVVYAESHSVITDELGLLSFSIGEGNVSAGTYASIAWNEDSYFVKIETDPAGGSNYTITSTSQLLSVPYVQHAKTADSVLYNTVRHYVGEMYGGGIVFNVFNDGRNGYIVSSTEVVPERGWGSWGVTTNVKNYYDGAVNTATIVATIGMNSAAGECVNYNAGGYTDWYLPAPYEMDLLYNSAAVLANKLQNDGDPLTAFDYNIAWTSYETTAANAYRKDFRERTTLGFGKENTYVVRCIRKF